MKTAFSTLELITTLTIGILAVLMVFRAFESSKKASDQAQRNSAAETEMSNAIHVIQNVGRIAQNCTATDSILTCRADFAKPPSGILTWVRFTVVSNQLQYQEDLSGTGSFSSVKIRKSFPNIRGFQVCHDVNMANNSCTLVPQSWNLIHSTYIAGRLNRFFRFAVTAGDPNKEGAFTLQGSLFVRNPTPIPGVSYEW